MKPIRWSDGDRYFGPFTYSHSKGYRPFAFVLESSKDEDDEDEAGCHLRISAFGRTLIMALPSIIKPWKKLVVTSWDDKTIKRLRRDWYWDSHPRVYGFSCSDGFLQIFYGRRTNDSDSEQTWSKSLPWTKWRFVRYSLYDLEGNHFWTQEERDRPRSGETMFERRREWNRDRHDAESRCPTFVFDIDDFDGERVVVTARLQERQWEFGEGWFKWLSLFRKPMIQRSIDLEFSKEVGPRKGSWKGGTTGHSCAIYQGEQIEDAVRRYCSANNMTFVDPIRIWLK